jgi:hypothetical protein
VIEVKVVVSRSGPKVGIPKRAGLDLLEITVVSQIRHGGANRRVDRAVCFFCHPIRDNESLEEQWGHFEGPSSIGVKEGKFRIGTESATGQIDRLHLGPQHAFCFVCVRFIRHDDSGSRSQSPKGSLGGGVGLFHDGRVHRLVPPDVATGRVVVVVGGEVVVVVGGRVVVVESDEEPAPRLDEVGVVEVEVEVEVDGAAVVEVPEVWGGALLDVDAPGCSLATTMPMTTVAPVAATATSRVRKRSDAAARRLVSGDETCRVDFIEHFLGSAPTDANK